MSIKRILVSFFIFVFIQSTTAKAEVAVQPEISQPPVVRAAVEWDLPQGWTSKTSPEDGRAWYVLSTENGQEINTWIQGPLDETALQYAENQMKTFADPELKTFKGSPSEGFKQVVSPTVKKIGRSEWAFAIWEITMTDAEGKKTTVRNKHYYKKEGQAVIGIAIQGLGPQFTTLNQKKFEGFLDSIRLAKGNLQYPFVQAPNGYNYVNKEIGFVFPGPKGWSGLTQSAETATYKLPRWLKHVAKKKYAENEVRPAIPANMQVNLMDQAAFPGMTAMSFAAEQLRGIPEDSILKAPREEVIGEKSWVMAEYQRKAAVPNTGALQRVYVLPYNKVFIVIFCIADISEMETVVPIFQETLSKIQWIGSDDEIVPDGVG